MQVFCFTTCSVLSCFTLFGIDILLHLLYCASSRTFELNWNPHWQCYRSLLVTSATYSTTGDQLLEESCLDLANNWMTNNGLKCNADKTKCMLIRSPRAGADPLPLHIHLSGSEIEQAYISIGKLFLLRTFLIRCHDRDVWYVPRTESMQPTGQYVCNLRQIPSQCSQAHVVFMPQHKALILLVTCSEISTCSCR